jgi:hypothetical protein
MLNTQCTVHIILEGRDLEVTRFGGVQGFVGPHIRKILHAVINTHMCTTVTVTAHNILKKYERFQTFSSHY